MNAQASLLNRQTRYRPVFDDANTSFLASDARYVVRLADGPEEVASALRLRHDVFNLELGVPSAADSHMDFDPFDLRCRHLIAVERSTGTSVGTYRINMLLPTESIDRLYSYGEFTIENLPDEVLFGGVEIGRACIAQEHRGSKALYLMWKGLAKFMVRAGKRYLFGCCSIFSDDRSVGSAAFYQLVSSSHVDASLHVAPRANAIDLSFAGGEPVELPALFEMYLKLGAKICGPPMYDEAFGTIDFFVIFDLERMNERYRRMFFS